MARTCRADAVGQPGAGPQEGTRERLLRSAAKLLAERGYGQTRLSDIAEAAGIRPPAIYYYFGSRDDLVAEVVHVGQQRVREHVEHAIETAAGTWMDRIEAAVAAHLRIELELSEFAAAVSRNAGHVPPRIRQTLQEHSDAYHETWRRLLRGAHEAGELRADLDPSIARMLVIGALNWAVEWWSADRPVDQLVENACSLIRFGLTEPSPA
jgi:TetR/AcrR family transcriptional regulator, cholesterol catabolism regulator